MLAWSHSFLPHLLVLLPTVKMVSAIFNPVQPTKGDSFNVGDNCTIAWDADVDGTWNNVTIDLVSGWPDDFVFVARVLSGLDGTDPTNQSFPYTLPNVTSADIYLYRFTNEGDTDPKWTSDFSITNQVDNSTDSADTPQKRDYAYVLSRRRSEDHDEEDEEGSQEAESSRTSQIHDHAEEGPEGANDDPGDSELGRNTDKAIQGNSASTSSETENQSTGQDRQSVSSSDNGHDTGDTQSSQRVADGASSDSLQKSPGDVNDSTTNPTESPITEKDVPNEASSVDSKSSTSNRTRAPSTKTHTNHHAATPTTASLPAGKSYAALSPPSPTAPSCQCGNQAGNTGPGINTKVSSRAFRPSRVPAGISIFSVMMTVVLIL
ncbi:hypothetical protein ABKN59_000476 [Abortiporus biennis]